MFYRFVTPSRLKPGLGESSMEGDSPLCEAEECPHEDLDAYYPNRDGESLTSALTSPRRTYYRWRKENPELDRQLRESAEAQRKDTSGTLQGEG